MSGKKKSKCLHPTIPYYYHVVEIKAKEARHVYVPYYETLTIKKILAFLEDGRNQVFDYLPDLQELDKIAREWICNVCCTVL